ncbi:MAG: hypothetical protein KAS52_08870, partial [Candidatus Heimdallarchaeota archaeon]|nr:hypothetical protein [Candidatus Heimdallarchaeota archaeon]
MSLYIIQSSGELTECSNKEVAIKSENVLLVISHLQKKIYTWIGGQASPHSKFACARETARIRMELGYKIVNLEESESTDEFYQAVDEACNINSTGKPSLKPKPLAVKPLAIKKPAPKPTVKTAAKPKLKPKSKPKPKPKTETKKAVTTKTERRYSSTIDTKVIDVEHVIKQLEILPPIDKSIRDYIIIDDSLYIAPENL